METIYLTPEEAEKMGFTLMTDQEAAELLGDDWETTPDEVPEEGGEDDESAAGRTEGAGK